MSRCIGIMNCNHFQTFTYGIFITAVMMPPCRLIGPAWHSWLKPSYVRRNLFRSISPVVTEKPVATARVFFAQGQQGSCGRGTEDCTPVRFLVHGLVTGELSWIIQVSKLTFVLMRDSNPARVITPTWVGRKTTTIRL